MTPQELQAAIDDGSAWKSEEVGLEAMKALRDGQCTWPSGGTMIAKMGGKFFLDWRRWISENDQPWKAELVVMRPGWSPPDSG